LRRFGEFIAASRQAATNFPLPRTRHELGDDDRENIALIRLRKTRRGFRQNNL
jgi:hypothetical protein